MTDHPLVDLLRRLIATPSFSREETATADILAGFLAERGHVPERYGNNVVAWYRCGVPGAPVVVLNSHHDTVRPGSGWTSDPHDPVLRDGKLTGLGSNDAGAPLMMMLAGFLHAHATARASVDVCFAATAEEEVSGADGMALLVRDAVFGAEPPALVLCGEPTGMALAVAERGLLVLDCVATGRTGHAARNEGDNAIYRAMDDVAWFRDHRFDRTSDVLGEVKMTVTQIAAGNQHNVVPDTCTFVVDVRTTDRYTNQELLDIIRTNVRCTVTPRSVRLSPSAVDAGHPFVRAAVAAGIGLYGSPTMSDQSLLPGHWASAKIGPGDSARSHTPDEYVYVRELLDGIDLFTRVLDDFLEKV